MFRCKQCGLYYVAPRPSAEEVGEFYQCSYYRNDPNFERGAKEKAFQKGIEKIERKLGRRGKLLDVGCGGGDFLTVTKERSWEVMGLEPSATAAKFTRNRLRVKVVEGTLDEDAASFEPEYFDAITLWDVIEHTTDPLNTVKIAFHLLVKGGVLVLRSPNMDFHRIRMRFFPWIGRRQGRNIFLDATLHLFGFSSHTIRILLQKAGFKEIEISTGVPREAGKALLRFTRDALYTLAKMVFFLTHRKVLLSSSMLILARKLL